VRRQSLGAAGPLMQDAFGPFAALFP